MIRVATLLTPILRMYPWAIPTIIVLGILSALSEGFGISLFVPLLQGLDPSSTQAAGGNELVARLNRLFIDIPINYRFLVITGFVFGSILLKNFLLLTNRILFSWLNAKIGHQLRSRVFNQLLSVSYKSFGQYETGDLINILATETWKTTQALSTLVGLIISFCTVTVFVVLMFLLSWWLTLLIGVMTLLISYSIYFVTKQANTIGKEAVEMNEKLAHQMWEGFSGMRVIRLFRRESYEQEKFDQASYNVQTTFFKLDLINILVGPFSEILSAALVLGILVIATMQDQSSLPTLLTFLFILYRLQPQVRNIDGARVGLMSLSASIEKVMAFLDRTNKSYVLSGVTPFRGLQKSISYESVTFSYDNLEKPAIKDVTLHIPKGKTTALVGPSGSGKSTLISLLCRFYEPTSGEIYIDQLPLRQLNLDDWLNRIAIVNQDIYLFSATIKENIAYGRLEATQKDIINAAKLANAHDFISALPDGYETKVGDRGHRLSGGQRQRIALARAIVRDPDILILDEATNSLDSIAENLIQEAVTLLSRDRTVLIIAHRLSTIEQADQIIVLENGRVVEQGDLKYLLSLNGLFSRLYHLQYRTA